MKRTISLAILFACAAGAVSLLAKAQAPREHPWPVENSKAPQNQKRLKVGDPIPPDAQVGAPDYLELGSARVWLGMTKAQVAEALKGYSVTKNGDVWLAMDLAEPEPGIAGMTFQFTAGRLNGATREWPIRGGDVAGTIFAVVSHWERERAGQGKFLVPCGVHTDVAASPDATFQRTSIECGQKAVVIMKDTSGNQPQGVAEALGELIGPRPVWRP